MNDNYISIMLSHKEILANKWLQEVREIYPDMPLDSNEYINNYLDYVIRLDIPEDHHPFLNSIPQWSKITLDRYNYIEYILITTNIWRKNIFDTIDEVAVDREIAYQIIKKYIFRIDLFEKLAREQYWSLTQNAILERDRKINELHNERLSLVGKMAASMAHEIRNPLTSIQGFFKLIKQRVSSEMNQQIDDYLNIIEDEFETIHMQISGFLSFSKNRVNDESFDNISLVEIVKSVLTMLNPRLIEEDVTLINKLKKDIIIRVQRRGIQQVISNLLNNAIDALTEVSHKKNIKLSIKEDDNNVYMLIANNGTQISEEIKDKLFTPFITDKPSGTGLGLAICKQIMQTNDGDIILDMNQPETTFILSFKKDLL